MIAPSVLLVAAALAAQNPSVAPTRDTTKTPHAADTGQPIPADAPATSRMPVVDTVLDRRARALNMQLRCPVCQSASIQESPANQAVEMKAVVREKLVAGESERDILDYFVSRYGDWVLLNPPKRGFNLLVFLLPLALLVGGAAFVFVTAKKWTRNA